MKNKTYSISVNLYENPKCNTYKNLNLLIVSPVSDLESSDQVFNIALDAIHTFGLELYTRFEQANLTECIISDFQNNLDKPDYEKDGWLVYWINKQKF